MSERGYAPGLLSCSDSVSTQGGSWISVSVSSRRNHSEGLIPEADIPLFLMIATKRLNHHLLPVSTNTLMTKKKNPLNEFGNTVSAPKFDRLCENEAPLPGSGVFDPRLNVSVLLSIIN